MNEKFMRIYDIRTRTSCIININQIVWVNIDARTLMMSAPSEKGLFHLSTESIEKVMDVLDIIDKYKGDKE